ncbi:DUF488 domain-containing protein [Geminocystis sp. GBBB08]|uniref:DUF488 domain-containing protein n=1 Tax=Geminocystis sp. GBBB08 TaxID=2604140 RepID=UPI0027E23330|nr:DUF488 domain-containing protein [Geminocystis sp. GBBB08]MBL1211287.1 DUF488 domain-containing protein [Geminocystis sp. GBBB08]
MLLTFGYGNRKDYDIFLKYLQEFNITCVIDIRLSPRAWSRKWYGDSIEKLCLSQNIKYLSKIALGNTSGNSHWIPPSIEEAEKELLQVSKILQKGNVLLLCAEIDYQRCHRTEIALKLEKLTNTLIKHLK